MGLFFFTAFGLAFLAAPKMLMEMKSVWNPPFDNNHLFLCRFCGFSMVTIAYTVYSLLDTADGFTVAGIWLAGAGLLGPAYAILYLEPIMTPDGIAGDAVLILVAGVVGFLCTM